MTEAKVLHYLRQTLRRQNRQPERDEIHLVKRDYSFAYKGYSAAVRRRMSEELRQPMARFAMLKGIREEQAEGCVKDWAEKDALEEEYCTDFYEAWHRDEYSEKHFTASIEKLSLTLPQRIIEAE